MTYTDDLDLSGYEELTVGFGFVAKSMENGEDFVLEYSRMEGEASLPSRLTLRDPTSRMAQAILMR